MKLPLSCAIVLLTSLCTVRAADTAAAKITIDPPASSMVTSSTYLGGSFKIQNLSTGGQDITRVAIDISTAMLPDLVFDTTGAAGDSVHKGFTKDSSTSTISVKSGGMTKPHNGVNSDDGYDAVDVSFNAFPSGATFSFSADIDPNNVKGVAQPGENDAASVSGLELIGTMATVYFSDGSTQATRVSLIPGSVDGSNGWAQATKPPMPDISVPGKTTPFQTSSAQQTVRVTGQAGSAVTVAVVEAGLYLGGVPNGGYHVSPYDANTAIKVTYLTATIGSSGFVDVPVTLTHSDPKAGYNFITACIANSSGIKSAVSEVLEIFYVPAGGGDTQPPTQPGTLSFTSVTSSSATINWGAATDNAGVTGYRISRGSTVIGTASARTFTDTGLSPATSYTYSVVALDAAGNVSAPTSGTVATTSGGSPSGTTIRINAGGAALVDSRGQTWAADSGYNTGSKTTSTATVSGTADPTLFKTERYDAATMPELAYAFSLPNGSYTVKLYFAETYGPTSGPGLRVFDVALQGQVAFANVDIYSQAGGANKALVLSAPATVTDGRLLIGFTHKVENPKINAIEIVPAAGDTNPPSAPGSLTFSNVTSSSVTVNWGAATDDVGVTGYRISRNGTAVATVNALSYTDSGRAAGTTYNYSVVALDAAGNVSTPRTGSIATTSSGGGTAAGLRINAGGPAYVDTSGQTWSADYGYNTGKSSKDVATVSGTTDPQLFKTLRFDESTAPELLYTLPIANGTYAVKLYFAETSSTGNGAGLRVFHVDVQSQRAFSNVDIFSQAGGMYQALVLQTTATVANGQLQIQFLHVKNHPRVNAIEVIAAP